MNESRGEEQRRGARMQRAATIFVSIACVLVLGVMIAVAVKMVVAGRGLETHRSHWLVEDSWIGFLVTMTLCFVAVICALGWRALQRWNEKRHWSRHEAKWPAGQKPGA
jgi:protein-S-isoprenylcysteine O-methyltransferase Ste14